MPVPWRIVTKSEILCCKAAKILILPVWVAGEISLYICVLLLGRLLQFSVRQLASIASKGKHFKEKHHKFSCFQDRHNIMP